MAKEVYWKGNTEEQVKELDLKAFGALLPARRRRSLERGFTDAQKRFLARIDAGENNVKTHCRNLVIIPSMLGKTVRVYNGKDFVPVIITLEMLGHVIGEFAHSRKLVKHSSAGVGATRSSKAVSAR
ncbi:TPA: 30S ribosomal protein S19 [Candidatus Woesearchaeota archaeon]|jgi:small subunit ribosomal protein S19|nr:30S ribosomal protein S19 [archaeon]HIJ12015.1 30S ribosomal protein S19 [Candidatus Woesearchaeota archaeon]